MPAGGSVPVGQPGQRIMRVEAALQPLAVVEPGIELAGRGHGRGGGDIAVGAQHDALRRQAGHARPVQRRDAWTGGVDRRGQLLDRRAALHSLADRVRDALFDLVDRLGELGAGDDADGDQRHHAEGARRPAPERPCLLVERIGAAFLSHRTAPAALSRSPRCSGAGRSVPRGCRATAARDRSRRVRRPHDPRRHA